MSKIRLTCPNCDAQYEVPAEVIPQTGRDVQCSNCSHTWFQTPRLLQPTPVPPPSVPPSLEPLSKHPTAPDDDLTTPSADEIDIPRRRLDPKVADVLREEAALEMNKRLASQQPLESQPELGLREPDNARAAAARRSRQAREHMSAPGMQAAKEPTPTDGGDGEPERRHQDNAERVAPSLSRSSLLPDVEDVQENLRSVQGPHADGAPRNRIPLDDGSPKQTGGFARGFAFAFIFAAMALGLYLVAPQVSKTVPELEPALTSYTTWVNRTRIQLDQSAHTLLITLQEMSSEARKPVPIEDATSTEGIQGAPASD